MPLPRAPRALPLLPCAWCRQCPSLSHMRCSLSFPCGAAPLSLPLHSRQARQRHSLYPSPGANPVGRSQLAANLAGRSSPVADPARTSPLVVDPASTSPSAADRVGRNQPATDPTGRSFPVADPASTSSPVADPAGRSQVDHHGGEPGPDAAPGRKRTRVTRRHDHSERLRIQAQI